MNDATATIHMRPSSGLLRTILTSPLWALPFALFFGTLFGASWASYRLAYVEALVFALAIRLALWAVARWVVNAMRIPATDQAWLPITLLHVAGAFVGSFAAAGVIQVLIDRRFVDDPRGVIAVALWALLFSVLFSGVILAMRFRESALEQAAQVERIRAELMRAELRALQAQVNPHFLFNTLNSIAALIAENPAAAEDLTTRLADVFRYALTSTRKERVRFADELEFVRTCLSIERVRFGSRLRVSESIEHGLDDVPVPALLLQPLVENAVRYAVSPREQGGEVRIEARRAGDSLRVTIADDGPGITPGEAPRGHGVGLESVRERLRLAGDGHALDVDSAPDRGTRVAITLPLLPKTSAGPPTEAPASKECPT